MRKGPSGVEDQDTVARAHKTGRGTRRRTSRGVLVILALGVVAGSLGLGLILSILWPRWPAAVDPAAPDLPITVAGVTFNVPPAAIRVAVQRHAGAQERIDLRFVWPGLTPPDPAAKPSPDHPIDILFLSIETAAASLAPAERLQAIYPRYSGETFVGPDGLHAVKFRDGTPYQGEDLFIDTTAPDRFTARCSRGGRGEMPGTCLVERRIGGAALTARFPRDWLPQWRAVSAGLDRLIATLRPAAS